MARTHHDVRKLIAQTELAKVRRSREMWEGLWRSVAVVGPAALKYGCIAWGCAKAAAVLTAWTGATTVADVKLNVATEALSKPEVGLTLPWLVAIVVWILYRKERSLKEEALERLGVVNRKYESLSDPNRSSSQLSPSERTNPRDEP
jgi:hypothetical protein